MSESHYIGLDVSARTVNLCVVDHNRRVAHERKLSSDPEEIVQHILVTAVSDRSRRSRSRDAVAAHLWTTG